MTAPVCSITGNACQCAAGSGCAQKRKNAATLRIAEQGIEGVRLALQDVERELLLGRPFPGPELREAIRLALAIRVSIHLIAESFEK